jgi:hypothetical protein
MVLFLWIRSSTSWSDWKWFSNFEKHFGSISSKEVNISSVTLIFNSSNVENKHSDVRVPLTLRRPYRKSLFYHFVLPQGAKTLSLLNYFISFFLENSATLFLSNNESRFQQHTDQIALAYSYWFHKRSLIIRTIGHFKLVSSWISEEKPLLIYRFLLLSNACVLFLLKTIDSINISYFHFWSFHPTGSHTAYDLHSFLWLQ